MMMNKFEKRVCIIAIIFVAVYIAAITITLHSRVSHKDKITRIESTGPAPGEEHLMLAELLLPMLILLTITVCFIIVKKKREKDRLIFDESEEEFQ